MEAEHKVALALLISLLVIFGSFIALITAVHGEEATSSGWKYYKEIDISLNTTLVQNSTIIRFKLINSTGTDDPANHTLYTPSQNFPFDLRFTLSSPDTPLPQFLDYYDIVNGNKVIKKDIVYAYVKIPKSTTKFYLYYDNPSAQIYSDGSAVFDHFDDFNYNSTTDSKFTNLYTVSSTTAGKANISNSILELSLIGNGYSNSVSVATQNPVITDLTQNTNNYALLVVKFNLRQDTDPYPYGRFGLSTTTTYDSSTQPTDAIFSPSQRYSVLYFLGNSVNASAVTVGRWYIDQMTLKQNILYNNYSDYSTEINSYNNQSSLTTQSSFYFIVGIAMTPAQTYTLDIDYFGVALLQDVNYNLTAKTLQVSDPSNDTGSGGGSGNPNSGGIWDSIQNFISQAGEFVQKHFFTLIFAALAVISLFARNGKAFIFFALLAVAAYYVIDPHISISQLFQGGGKMPFDFITLTIFIAISFFIAVVVAVIMKLLVARFVPFLAAIPFWGWIIIIVLATFALQSFHVDVAGAYARMLRGMARYLENGGVFYV